MRRTGESTRLFHAIVALGLSAASAACGGQTAKRPASDAGDEGPALEVPEASSAFGNFGNADGGLGPFLGEDAGDDAADAGDGWIPRPPVIA